MVNLLPSLMGAHAQLNKIKTVGVARQQRHFLCGDKKRSKRKLDAALGMSGSEGLHHQFRLFSTIKDLHITHR